MKSLHVVTVGISLITNFERERKADRRTALRQTAALAAFLQEAPRERSAELNALAGRTGFLDRPNEGLSVALVHSQTPEGRLAAAMIRKFLAARGVRVALLRLKGVELPAQTQADPQRLGRLATAGLRELRDKVHAHVLRRWRQEPDLHVEFNATGGYKAEVAVLYELGRFLRVPVYYLHETYRTTIELP